jgi:hypothetical protein
MALENNKKVNGLAQVLEGVCCAGRWVAWRTCDHAWCCHPLGAGGLERLLQTTFKRRWLRAAFKPGWMNWPGPRNGYDGVIPIKKLHPAPFVAEDSPFLPKTHHGDQDFACGAPDFIPGWLT